MNENKKLSNKEIAKFARRFLLGCSRDEDDCNECPIIYDCDSLGNLEDRVDKFELFLDEYDSERTPQKPKNK